MFDYIYSVSALFQLAMLPFVWHMSNGRYVLDRMVKVNNTKKGRVVGTMTLLNHPSQSATTRVQDSSADADERRGVSPASRVNWWSGCSIWWKLIKPSPELELRWNVIPQGYGAFLQTHPRTHPSSDFVVVGQLWLSEKKYLVLSIFYAAAMWPCGSYGNWEVVYVFRKLREKKVWKFCSRCSAHQSISKSSVMFKSSG
jgi:hypothetical protein